MKDTHKAKLLVVTGQPEIGFIAAGIESSETGYIVSENGLTSIAEALEAGDAAIAAAADQALQAQQAVAAQQVAETALATANANIQTQAATIDTLQARVAELESDPAITRTSKEKDKDKTEKTPFHLSSENPMNKIADSLLGTPVAKEEK